MRNFIGLPGISDGNCEVLLAMCRGFIEGRLPLDVVNLDTLCLGLPSIYEACVLIRDVSLGMHLCTEGEGGEIKIGDKTMIVSDISGRRLVGNTRFDDTMTLDGRSSDNFIRLNSAAAIWMSRSPMARRLLKGLPEDFRILFLGTVWMKGSDTCPAGYSPFEVPGVFLDRYEGKQLVCQRVPIQTKLPPHTYTAILV